jgi:hypothetical protein
MATLLVQRLNIFTNFETAKEELSIDCSNENDIISNSCQIIQQPEKYIEHLYKQILQFTTDYLTNLENISQIKEEYYQINKHNDTERKLYLEKRAMIGASSKKAFDIGIIMDPTRKKLSKMFNIINRYIDNHESQWKLKDILLFVEQKISKIVCDKFQTFKIQNYITSSINISQMISSIIYQIIYDNKLFSDEITTCMCMLKYENMPEYVIKVLIQNIATMTNIIRLSKNYFDNDIIKTAIRLVSQYDQCKSSIFNINEFVNMNYDDAKEFIVRLVELNMNDIIESTLRPFAKYYHYVKDTVQNYMEMLIDGISDASDITDQMLRQIAICTIVGFKISLNTKENIMMGYLINNGINDDIIPIYSVLFQGFPAYIVKNWNMYLANVVVIDNIFKKVNFTYKEYFTSKALSWKESMQVNNNFRDMKLTIRSRHDDNDIININRELVTLNATESNCVVSKVSTESFVPSLRKYIATIYAFCDKRYNGGENQIDFKKSTITATIGATVVQKTVFQMNVIFAVISLINPTLSDVIHMLNYSTIMITTLKALMKEGILIKNGDVIIFNSEYFDSKDKPRIENEEIIVSESKPINDFDNIKQNIISEMLEKVASRKLKNMSKSEIISLMKSCKIPKMDKKSKTKMYLQIIHASEIKILEKKVKKNKQVYVT